jgi:O-glycosyl hydrolase
MEGMNLSINIQGICRRMVSKAPSWVVVLWGLTLLVWRVDAATVTINGAQTNQVIDGFGVNINHRSWTNSELQPVLDALIDQGGFTLFRVVFDNTDWEATNDNDDPDVMNWSYYNAVYGTPRFEKLWGIIGYLNQRGITNGVMLNFQGPGPQWMGGATLPPGYEDEWAEMIASLLVYARNTRHLQFSLVGPDNEPNEINQGVDVANAAQYATMLHLLAQKLDTNGLSDVRFLGPDGAGTGTGFMPELLNDPVVMGKVAHFSLHSYSGGGVFSTGVADFIRQSAYPDRTVWMTEFNVWCASCETGGVNTNSWTEFRGSAEYLLGHLANGVSAGLVWDGYDSFYTL